MLSILYKSLTKVEKVCHSDKYKGKEEYDDYLYKNRPQATSSDEYICGLHRKILIL